MWSVKKGRPVVVAVLATVLLVSLVASLAVVIVVTSGSDHQGSDKLASQAYNPDSSLGSFSHDLHQADKAHIAELLQLAEAGDPTLAADAALAKQLAKDASPSSLPTSSVVTKATQSLGEPGATTINTTAPTLVIPAQEFDTPILEDEAPGDLEARDSSSEAEPTSELLQRLLDEPRLRMSDLEKSVLRECADDTSEPPSRRERASRLLEYSELAWHLSVGRMEHIEDNGFFVQWLATIRQRNEEQWVAELFEHSPYARHWPLFVFLMEGWSLEHQFINNGHAIVPTWRVRIQAFFDLAARHGFPRHDYLDQQLNGFLDYIALHDFLTTPTVAHTLSALMADDRAFAAFVSVHSNSQYLLAEPTEAETTLLDTLLDLYRRHLRIIELLEQHPSPCYLADSDMSLLETTESTDYAFDEPTSAQAAALLGFNRSLRQFRQGHASLIERLGTPDLRLADFLTFPLALLQEAIGIDLAVDGQYLPDNARGTLQSLRNGYSDVADMHAAFMELVSAFLYSSMMLTEELERSYHHIISLHPSVTSAEYRWYRLSSSLATLLDMKHFHDFMLGNAASVQLEQLHTSRPNVFALLQVYDEALLRALFLSPQIADAVVALKNRLSMRVIVSDWLMSSFAGRCSHATSLPLIVQTALLSSTIDTDLAVSVRERLRELRQCLDFAVQNGQWGELLDRFLQSPSDTTYDTLEEQYQMMTALFPTQFTVSSSDLDEHLVRALSARLDTDFDRVYNGLHFVASTCFPDSRQCAPHDRRLLNRALRERSLARLSAVDYEHRRAVIFAIEEWTRNGSLPTFTSDVYQHVTSEQFDDEHIASLHFPDAPAVLELRACLLEPLRMFELRSQRLSRLTVPSDVQYAQFASLAGGVAELRDRLLTIMRANDLVDILAYAPLMVAMRLHDNTVDQRLSTAERLQLGSLPRLYEALGDKACLPLLSQPFSLATVDSSIMVINTLLRDRLLPSGMLVCPLSITFVDPSPAHLSETNSHMALRQQFSHGLVRYPHTARFYQARIFDDFHDGAFSPAAVELLESVVQLQRYVYDAIGEYIPGMLTSSSMWSDQVRLALLAHHVDSMWGTVSTSATTSPLERVLLNMRRNLLARKLPWPEAASNAQLNKQLCDRLGLPTGLDIRASLRESAVEDNEALRALLPLVWHAVYARRYRVYMSPCLEPSSKTPCLLGQLDEALAGSLDRFLRLYACLVPDETLTLALPYDFTAQLAEPAQTEPDEDDDSATDEAPEVSTAPASASISDARTTSSDATVPISAAHAPAHESNVIGPSTAVGVLRMELPTSSQFWGGLHLSMLRLWVQSMVGVVGFLAEHEQMLSTAIESLLLPYRMLTRLATARVESLHIDEPIVFGDGTTADTQFGEHTKHTAGAAAWLSPAHCPAPVWRNGTDLARLWLWTNAMREALLPQARRLLAQSPNAAAHPSSVTMLMSITCAIRLLFDDSEAANAPATLSTVLQSPEPSRWLAIVQRAWVLALQGAVHEAVRAASSSDSSATSTGDFSALSGSASMTDSLSDSWSSSSASSPAASLTASSSDATLRFASESSPAPHVLLMAEEYARLQELVAQANQTLTELDNSFSGCHSAVRLTVVDVAGMPSASTTTTGGDAWDQIQALPRLHLDRKGVAGLANVELAAKTVWSIPTDLAIRYITYGTAESGKAPSFSPSTTASRPRGLAIAGMPKGRYCLHWQHSPEHLIATPSSTQSSKSKATRKRPPRMVSGNLFIHDVNF